MTGGGDAPALNCVIRAFVKHATASGIEVLGSEDGFDGLINNRLIPLTPADVRGLLPRGGSILGCSNRSDPFAYKRVLPRGRVRYEDVSQHVLGVLRAHGIDVLVTVGGDGTIDYASRFMKMGVPVIGVPKTIDNDLAHTDKTFGFESAVATATWAVDALHATAESHDRVMILEVMGRHAGWIALAAGIAGGADVILIPELPYDTSRIVEKIEARSRAGAHFSIIVIGEGAKPEGGGVSITKKATKGTMARLGGAGEHLAGLLEGRIAHDLRVTVLGHLQRGGSPVAFDRLLGTRYGVKAAQLCARGETGRLVSLVGQSVTSVPFPAPGGPSRLVSSEHELLGVARAVGIELGVSA